MGYMYKNVMDWEAEIFKNSIKFLQKNMYNFRTN